MKKTYKQIKINKDWIEKNIIKPGWQRSVYPARVNRFLNHIKNGTFYESDIIVAIDERTKKFILLDGQHKVEAIRRSNKNIVVGIMAYEGLDDDDMRKIYVMENDVKGFRIIDDLELFIGKNDWLDALLESDKFPITITRKGGVNALRLDKVLSIIFCAEQDGISRQTLSRSKLPTFLATLDSEKYKTTKEFFTLYKKCFGDPSNENWVYKFMILMTLFKVWKANRTLFKEEKIIEAFRKVEKNARIRQDSYGVDNMSLASLTRNVYLVINKKRSTNKFVNFWDEE